MDDAAILADNKDFVEATILVRNVRDQPQNYRESLNHFKIVV